MNKLFFFLLSIFSGILLYFSHPIYNIPLICFFAFIPLLYVLDNSKKPFIDSTIAGFVYYFLLFLSILTIREGAYGFIGNGKILFYLFLVVLSLFAGMSYGLWAHLIKYLKHKRFNQKNYDWKNYLIAGLLFAILEFILTIIFSLIVLGNQSTINTNWTIGNIGYNLVNYGFLANISKLGGIYLISVILIWINILIYRIFNQRFKIRKESIIIVVIFLIVAISNMHSKSAYENISLGVVQSDESEIQYHINNLTNVKIVLLQEMSGQYKYQDYEAETASFIFTPNNDKLFVYSRYITVKAENISLFRNELVYINGETAKYVSYYKNFLMPLGEYNPYIYTVKKIEVVKGNNISFMNFQGHSIGGTICGGFISPSLIREIAQNSEIILNSASSGSFREGSQYREINLQYARIRAIENNRYFIQSSAQGYSFIIDNNGKVLHLIKDISGGEITEQNVKLIKSQTIYTFLGEWTIIILFCVGLILINTNFIKK